MEYKDFKIAYSERKSLSLFTRIFNSILGLILTIFVITNYQFQDIPLLIIGLSSILYGIVGLDLFKTNYCINVTHDSIEIIKSFQQDIVIDLNKIKYIALRYNELHVHYADYVKTYKIPWLTSEDYQKLSNKLDEINEE